jgi:5'-3' exonuclease
MTRLSAFDRPVRPLTVRHGTYPRRPVRQCRGRLPDGNEAEFQEVQEAIREVTQRI